ncbi:MAG: hypothetical protein O7A09_07895 [Proteobacteria bacterium]|nr:hypothetical protein [Pseudomonadota bacterium]
MAVVIVLWAGRPLNTPDLWWHLQMGEIYATEGPWPEGGDPLLHTAHDDAPVQHEWLFGVALHGVDRLHGFTGLRMLHALAAAAILALAWCVFRRAAASATLAALAAATFAILSAWRLTQLRPDLASIPAALAVYALLLAPEGPPSWRRVAAATGLLLVWANLHSLFAIGLALIVAALLGGLLQSGLALRLPAEERPTQAATRARLRRLGAALALGFAATLVNPRGIAQHLTFFTSTREAAIWMVKDEWTRFDPFAFHGYGHAVTRLGWLTTDAIGLAFVAVAGWALLRFLRRPSARALRACDPVHLGLGLAGVVAILTSIRFQWMAFLPILFLLRAHARLTRRAPAWDGAAALAALALVVAFVVDAAGSGALAELRNARAYLSRPYAPASYHASGVRMLEDAGIEGNLFNAYHMGGYLAYWLSPRVRTFIDGRTEHYDEQVFEDHQRASRGAGARAGETLVDLLDRRRVDVFFGVGLPTPRGATDVYTTALLEGEPGWVRIDRGVDYAIYVRRNERNAGNLARAAAYYAERGLPFDPERGLDVGAVLRDHPEWAVAHRLLPVDRARLEAAARGGDENARFAALDTLGLFHLLAGAYEEQLAFDREAAQLRPRAVGPRRRIVYALLRLDRPGEALAAARELTRIDPDPGRAQAFERVARLAQGLGGGSRRGPAERARLARELHTLPLLARQDAARTLGGRLAAPALPAGSGAWKAP